ncbi:MAG: lysoplasmalogenase [Chloroflexi bacterium]|nr:lysoplasmalogenase [Chloroflexota bacterium]
MTGVESTGLAAAMLLALVDWAAVARADARLERWAKPAVMVALLGAVVLSDPEASTRSLLLAAALGASLVGDILLLPPTRFTAGLVAFLLAHVAYIGAFLLGPLFAPPAVLGVLVALAVLAIPGRPILAGATAAGMRWPVAIYFAAIVLMVISATASGSPFTAIGAWLFVASDARLGWGQFVTPHGRQAAAPAWHRLGVLVPYHAGQILLTTTILLQRAS